MEKEKVRTAINVAALVLVPLINERHRIKDHKEVQKATDFSVKTYHHTKDVALRTKDNAVHTTQKVAAAANTVKNTTVNVAQFVSDKAEQTKKEHRYNQQMTQHIKKEKEAKKQQKAVQKDITKLDNNLSKNIENRHHEEEKQREKQQKAMVKEMKDYKDYKAKTQKPKRSLFGFKRADKSAQNVAVQQFASGTAAPVKSVELTPPPKEKAHVKAASVEENYDNARLFEQHRKQMASKIARR